MWLLKRNGKELKTGVPTDANQGQPMWLIWLLSAGTFVVTVVIVLGLFWAGRWVINRSTDKPAPAKPVATTQKPTTSKPQNGATPSSGISSTPSTTPKPSPTPTPGPATTSPVTGPTNLVSTGPTSDE